MTPAAPRPLRIVESHKDVHAASFDAFYREQVHELIGLAYALSGSRNGAEDLAHDALMSAARRWDDVSQFDDPGAWIRRAVANRSVSVIRRRVTEARCLIRLAGRHQHHVVSEMPAETEHVWRLIRALPKRQAQVVTLRALERWSLDEIAEVLQISRDTAATHLRRARATLSQQLSVEE